MRLPKSEIDYDLQAEIDECNDSVRLVFSIPSHKIFEVIGAYPVVVEMWYHCVGNSAAGSKKRKFHAEFNEKERKKAREMYNMFYRWYLVRGTPNTWVASAKTIHFCRRLIYFFGTV